MLYVDVKYASMLSPYLRNFKQKKDYLWNYSCPVCGDSHKNKLRARGFIYRQKNDLFVKCHNCGYGTNIGNFLKFVNQNLYDEYVLERYKSGVMTRYNDHKDINEVDQRFADTAPTLLLEDDALSKIKRVDKLNETHPAVKYVISRKIPSDKWHLIYFAPKFMKWINTLMPNKFDEKALAADHPRLVFPFFTTDGKMFACAGRAFGKEDPKYYTIKFDDDADKIYGMDRVDYSRRIFVVEGQVDSLFLPNAVAVAGASFDTPFVQKIKTNCIVVMDNEPRNKDIVRQLAKYIQKGYTVCMFPDTIQEKDINEMILAGKSVDEIINIINTNSFQGMEAQLKFATWRKC